MTYNFHVHTAYSDGVLSPEELITIAKARRVKFLGFSDHAFSGKLSLGKQITGDLKGYLKEMRKIQKQTSGIEIKIGVEIDTAGMDMFKFYQEIPTLNKFDYVLFEYVETKEEHWGEVQGKSLDKIIKLRKRLKIPVGLAHNDLQLNFKGREEETARKLSQNSIFIELNQSEKDHRDVGRNTRDGQDYYNHFSDVLIEALNKYSVKILIGTDSHTGESLGKVENVMSFIGKHFPKKKA